MAGLHVELTISRNGVPITTVELIDPAVTQLAPDASYSGSTSFTPDALGTHEVTGRTTIELR